ncbi:hypothetical protein [Micromonospora sp. NPDC050695]|uniref:hypothetical protein n=1 Tax=Micromonospora sp. NPDC050695 TaxID=3154938 RepID=UPI0033C61A7F
MTIEEYAVQLVADGAESYAEDDTNENEDIADEDLRPAIKLAVKIAHAIRANPQAVLALVDTTA